MRDFFNSHWKTIVAILLAIALATLTIETSSNEPPLAARLQTHARALAPDATHDALRHVETALRSYGYAAHVQRSSSAGYPERSIEASIASLAPGGVPTRTFIVGARVGPGSDIGAAAALELARAVSDLRPMPGTAIRFVFFMDDTAASHRGDMIGTGGRGADNFMAFIGTPDASQRVHQAFAALRSDPVHLRHGLATSGHVMGLTLTGKGGGHDGATTLLITGSGFLGYPYFQTSPLPGQTPPDVHDLDDYDALARVVSGLVRTMKALAGVVQV